MPARKNGYTLGQHRQMGKELVEIRERLLELADESTEAYGQSFLAVKQLKRAVQYIDAARFELNEKVFAEHPELSNEDSKRVYYPGEYQKL